VRTSTPYSDVLQVLFSVAISAWCRNGVWQHATIVNRMQVLDWVPDCVAVAQRTWVDLSHRECASWASCTVNILLYLQRDLQCPLNCYLSQRSWLIDKIYEIALDSLLMRDIQMIAVVTRFTCLLFQSYNDNGELRMSIESSFLLSPPVYYLIEFLSLQQSLSWVRSLDETNAACTYALLKQIDHMVSNTKVGMKSNIRLKLFLAIPDLLQSLRAAISDDISLTHFLDTASLYY
jgi:hypothetical protein